MIETLQQVPAKIAVMDAGEWQALASGIQAPINQTLHTLVKLMENCV